MTLLKLGFTGTQIGMTDLQKKALIAHLRRWKIKHSALEIHHGDCVGADIEFQEICLKVWGEENFELVLHPPVNPGRRAFASFKNMRKMPKKPYLERNHEIVDAVDGMVAAPKSNKEELRSGTWATIRYSKAQSVPLIMLKPE